MMLDAAGFGFAVSPCGVVNSSCAGRGNDEAQPLGAGVDSVINN